MDFTQMIIWADDVLPTKVRDSIHVCQANKDIE